MTDLVYNRKASDFYNISDLNRVEEWIQYLGSVLDSIGSPPGIRKRKTWTATNVPRYSDFVRIREDIYRLRDSFFARMPGWIYFDITAKTTDVTEWNAWEYDLSLINDYLQASVQNMQMFRQAESETYEPRWMESGGLLNK